MAKYFPSWCCTFRQLAICAAFGAHERRDDRRNAFGALLCVVNTFVSIVFIVLVQLNYVIAPRIRLLYRL